VGLLNFDLVSFLFAISFSKLISFLKLQARLEGKTLRIKNNGISGEYFIYNLKLLRHVRLGYIEIFRKNSELIFCSDSFFKKLVTIFNSIESMQNKLYHTRREKWQTWNM